MNKEPLRAAVLGATGYTGQELVALLTRHPRIRASFLSSEAEAGQPAPGTALRYQRAADVPLQAVDGIILLDGAGYDVARQMARPGNLVAGMYDAAFGRDPRKAYVFGSDAAISARPRIAPMMLLKLCAMPLASEPIVSMRRARCRPVSRRSFSRSRWSRSSALVIAS